MITKEQWAERLLFSPTFRKLVEDGIILAKSQGVEWSVRQRGEGLSRMTCTVRRNDPVVYAWEEIGYILPNGNLVMVLS